MVKKKMDRNNIIWVVECCVLSLDGVCKKKLIEFGASENEAQMRIQLYEYLKNKEMEIEIENGYQT